MNKFYAWRSQLLRKSAFLRRLIVLTVLLLPVQQLLAQNLPPGFNSGKVQDGYDGAMGLVFSNDGRQMFVFERQGIVRVSHWNGTTYVKQLTPVIDIREEVGNWGEVGLQSICLDPDFQRNGLLYAFYAVDRHHLLHYGTPQYSSTANDYNSATIGRVTRYKINDSGTVLTGDYASRTVLLGETKQTGIPILKGTHFAGTILFGRDGTLLLSTGDNADWATVDIGSNDRTFYQTALNDGIITPAENVGALRAQMVNSLCGKVLRIDPNTGNGLSSNPFYDSANPRSPKSRVWTLGFRSPFRMTINPNTGSTNAADGNPGTLLVGDVGWFNWEELDVIDKAGLNGGWPIYEGMGTTGGYYGTNVRNGEEPGQPTFESLCQQPTSPVVNPNPANRRFTHARPALDWLRDQPVARVPSFSGSTPTAPTIGTAGAAAGVPFAGNCAIGGAYYTGTLFPDMYRNTYFFADLGRNWIKNAVLHDGSDHAVHEVRDFAPDGFTNNVVSLATNPLDGSLFFINVYLGEVIRIGYGGNRPPVAKLSVDKTFGTSPFVVQFNSAESTDPDGNTLTYDWDFGDGTTATGVNPTHTFSATTTVGYTVTLTVKDNGNLTDTKTVLISVNNEGPPSVQIVSPIDGAQYPLDRESSVKLLANATDKNTTATTPQFVKTYEWQLTLRHNTHEHRDPVITEISPTVAIAPTGCIAGETYYYMITCKVTDNGGLVATDSVKLYPNCNSGSVAVRNVVATPELNAVRVNWENPSAPFQEILVAARENTGFTDRPTGTAYTANADYNGNGTAIEGGKVVYRGDGINVIITNLNTSGQYFFRVYTRVDNLWNGGVEVNAKPTIANCSMFTVKTGSWNDATVWSCNRVPTSSDAVAIKHSVNVPNNYTALALAVDLDTGMNVSLGTNATLKLNQ